MSLERYKGGWLKSLRTASIYSITVGSRCRPGLGIIATESIKSCTMGYDIEISQSLTRDGSFPPSYSRITSIALWCTCGYCRAWTTIRHKKVNNIVYFYNSSRTIYRIYCRAYASMVSRLQLLSL